MPNTDERSQTSPANPLNEAVEPALHSSEEKDKQRHRHLRHEVRVWTRDLLIAIGLALVIIIFLYQPVKVEGTSMAPLLSDQERIFINKFVYRFEDSARRCSCVLVSAGSDEVVHQAGDCAAGRKR